ncbi:type I-E CRISPR-associated protein Cas5/CasD [Chlorobaculum sp. MV4-Y]|uniref:type I-E CRISPR-associated protein Cas5/CasD n=1 Tax=Chlorobaculum sp. MV4-Y TaxID=2976335 RepID=UPI0021AE3D04|nr:type I-E CRISPR-associated protein Cas5/CasD [Chlorobaculum sp. MV4-Y]UWX57360.1 type I-E CRISPR-associated protein Cas5/CasD [Chlorobaculum sp. MV4-Y]
MSNPFILLWLEAPLQSWGADSRFGRRDTLDFPTKSGLLGLLCCALGAGGEQRELLDEMAPLRQTVIAFQRERGERPPLLRDFQMVGSGYDEKDDWEKMLIPRKRDGGIAVGGGTKMTYRYYLQEATFAAAVEVPAARATEFAEALQAPVWDIYFGRKCCAPTDLVFRGCFESEAEAFVKAASIAAEKHLAEAFRVRDYAAGDESAGEVVALNDVPVQFGTRKKYRERRVTIIHESNEE